MAASATSNGQLRRFIAALDPSTGLPTAWNPDANSSVTALAVSGGTVFAGGDFTHIGGRPRNHLAAIDAGSGASTAWNPNVNDGVLALALSGSTLYAGGPFIGAGGEPRSGLAAIAGPDLPTPTLLAQFDATTVADGIELRWRFGDANRVTKAAVERALDGAGPWLAIAPELHEESGVAVALDRAADGSEEYFYRLVAQLTNGTWAVFGPVSASRRELLSRSDLTLVTPNPTSDGAQVQYGVSRRGRVRLELVDVSGRVAATLADRVHSPGQHVVSWNGAGQLSPGLYFVRLAAEDRVAVRKLAIIR